MDRERETQTGASGLPTPPRGRYCKLRIASRVIDVLGFPIHGHLLRFPCPGWFDSNRMTRANHERRVASPRRRGRCDPRNQLQHTIHGGRLFVPELPSHTQARYAFQPAFRSLPVELTHRSLLYVCLRRVGSLVGCTLLKPCSRFSAPAVRYLSLQEAYVGTTCAGHPHISDLLCILYGLDPAAE